MCSGCACSSGGCACSGGGCACSGGGCACSGGGCKSVVDDMVLGLRARARITRSIRDWNRACSPRSPALGASLSHCVTFLLDLHPNSGAAENFDGESWQSACKAAS
ncbi:MAG: hypothetical protein EXR77_15245 [Myxococcales bacterium]|nr:hypothetical protein [Myxococcales bacterium]